MILGFDISILFSIVIFGIICLVICYLFLVELGFFKPKNLEPSTLKRLSKQKPVSRWHWIENLQNFWRGFGTEELRVYITIAVLVLLSRLIIALIGYMGIMLFRNETNSFFNTLPWMWNKWDASHLLNIAEHGYVTQTDEKYFIVFYPFYPLLVRLFTYLTGNNVYAGFLVSNISLVVASIYLYRLAKIDFDSQIAWNTVKYLLIFPVSFFLGIVYTDSLFLALSILCLYYLRQKKWLIAGLWGAIASLTRNFGILLLIPAVIEILTATQWLARLREKRFGAMWAELGKASICLFLIPVGAFIYLLINKVVTGDWFTFLKYQSEHWSNRVGFFAENIRNYTQNALTWKPADQIALWIPQVLAILLVTILIFYAFRKIHLSYIAYMFGYLFVCVSSTWLISGPRYLMVLFPLYILLAKLSRHRILNAILTFTSIMLLCFYTIAFVMDFNVM